MFPTTQWGAVLAAGRPSAPDARTSLETLCRAYWQPVYAYARLGGRDPEDAKDLTQGFFAHLLERNLVRIANPERGRFRSFLKGAFDHFVSNEWRKARAQKRGSGRPEVSFSIEDAESRLQVVEVDPVTPETAFELHWARAVVARALENLGEEMRARGDEQRFRILSSHLTGRRDAEPLRETARKLDLSESAIKVAIHRLRKRFGALLRHEVAQTLDDPARTDEELRHILQVLGG